jgi:hypothetical protein
VLIPYLARAMSFTLARIFQRRPSGDNIDDWFSRWIAQFGK